MNNGYTDVENNVLTGELAPITRIGGGEVRVDQAIAAPAAAWDNDVPQGALSFGFVDVADDVVTITRTVRVRNYSNKHINYAVKRASASLMTRPTARSASVPRRLSRRAGSRQRHAV